MIEKVLLCKIISLSKGRPCEMSNAAFASCFGVTNRRITEHIAKLREKGWIDVTGPRTKRYIKPTEKAISLWMFPSIDETIYRRKHLEMEPSSTIDGTVLNYRRNRPPKNIENIESTKKSANDLRSAFPSQLNALFDTFWKAYPSKRDKKKAKQAFLRIQNIEAIFPAVMTALQKENDAREQAARLGRFYPSPKYAARWLNGKCWEDEPAGQPAGQPATPSASLWDMQELTPEEEAQRDEEAKALLERLQKKG